MLFFIRNLGSESVYRGMPWDGPPPLIPTLARTDKPSFIKWAQSISTDHMFFSAIEGESEALRLSKSNPAYRVHGVVADYDAKVTPDMLAGVARNSPTEFLPNFASRTFSGGARLVWIFEAPVTVAGNLAATSFMKTVAAELKLNRLLPGFDAPALLDPCKYYERGVDWQKISDHRIRPEFVWKWMADSGRRLDWKRGDAPTIPLDVVREQIEKEYPGKWQGAFELGVRSRRFWDPQADNDTAAVLRESGFQCFTGPDPFVSWGQLLGEAFVKRYDADRIGKVLRNIYFDDASSKYWFQDGRGRWVCESTTGISRLLRTEFGLDGKIPKGGTYSEVDKALLEVQKHRRVDAALPFLYNSPGVVRRNKRVFLNTSWAECREPAESASPNWGDDFPWIARYLEEFFVDRVQLDRFLAWWRWAYRGGLMREPQQGHALFFVGPPNCGKTLLNHRIVGESLGGAMDARAFLVEGSEFSGSNLEYPVMSLDDSSPASDYRKYQKYSAMVKAMVANPQAVYNQKYRAAGQVDWTGRILVSLNDDAKSLQMIPDLEQSLMEKIMIFRVERPKSYTFEEKYKLEATLERELPFALRWLLDWEVPEELHGDTRFGVKEYHHPELHRQALEADHCSSFLDILGLFLEEYATVNEDKRHWEGSAAMLLTEMSNCERVSTVSREFKTRQVGMHLRGLSSRGFRIRHLSERRQSGGNLWQIDLDCAK